MVAVYFSPRRVYTSELPNKIPVPEANSTSQMDEVGG